MAPAGALVFVMRSGVLQHTLPVSRLATDSAVNQDIKALLPGARAPWDMRYIVYFIHGWQSDLLMAWRDLGATVESIKFDAMLRALLPVPPMALQMAIADYLDAEIARVDELVAEKQRFIELLAERRSALVTHAVTRGIDSSVPRKASDSGWFGDVPMHWEVVRARYLLANRDDRSSDGSEELLTVSHITGVTARSAKTVHMFMAETNEGYKKCMAGDLVVNTMWAFAGAAGVAPMDGLVSPSYNVYRFATDVDPHYFDYLSRCTPLVGEYDRRSKGIVRSRLRLYPDQLFDIRLPLPPLDEQRAIAAYLDTETAAIDEIADATRQSIDLLKEYRTALISAAVTGQIDVSSMATPGESA